MENVSIKTFVQWRRDIKGNGTVLCSLNFGKGCPNYGIQTTGKFFFFFFLLLFKLNNELTRKRLCRCSMYVVSIIPKQDKSTNTFFSTE